MEKGVVAETPQFGHATYVFTKPRDMDNFLARYTKITKANIRGNQENVANGWDSSGASYTEQILFCGSTTSGNTWVKENKSNRPGA